MQDLQDLQIYVGTILNGCYEVESFLGEGGFGFVTKCRNKKTGEKVAIKVNKSSPEVVRQAREEIAMLKRLRSLDPDTCNIVRWNDFFFHMDSICINFELLDQSLHDHMKDRFFFPLSIAEVVPIIKQLATTLSHLKHLGIVHADLKPDNIMVVDRYQQPIRVKLIDFGLAYMSAGETGCVVQTLWYRAPEVILDLPFNEAIDMWSLGLSIAELVVGCPIYRARHEYEVLHHIVETQGQPADDVLERGKDTALYFNRRPDSFQQWQFKTPEQMEEEYGLPIEDNRKIQLACLDRIEDEMEITYDNQHNQHHFMDLLKCMLHLDPDLRIQPSEVLQHPLLIENSDEVDNEEVEPQMSQTEEPQPNPGHHTEEEEEASWAGVVIVDPEETGRENTCSQGGWFSSFYSKIQQTFCCLC